MIVFMQNLKGLRELTLKDLSRKLLAFSNGARSSDLHALDLRFRRFTDDGVLFSIPGLTKTRRSGPPKEAFYGSFSEDLSLCPEEKTASFRKIDNDKEAPLFISYRKPHNSVTSSSIARWLKDESSGSEHYPF